MGIIEKKKMMVQPKKEPIQNNLLDYMFYANQLAQIRIRNLESQVENNKIYNRYKKSEIINYLSNPATYEKQLRDMSIYLFNVSNYYRRLVEYFAYMSTFSYVVTSYGIDFSKSVNVNKYKKAYYSIISELEKMNIEHEFSKALVVAYRDDVFYGYVWENTDSFTIQKLDADYCKISSIEDGCYNFAFDFSYFDSNADKLPNYPPEFATMYQTYKKVGQTSRWQELDSTKSVCLKVNEHDYTPIPPFVSLFGSLADIEDYRAISKDASEISNYKAISMEIPINQNTGGMLLDYDMAVKFYDAMRNVLPENIGAILTPMKMNDWNFEKSGAMSDTDEVGKAEATMWSQAGVNKILFGGGDDPSASTLEICTVNDQMINLAMMNQVERWINRKLKRLSSSIKFKIKFLPVTHYNREKMHSQYLKDGQYGLPVRSAIMATEEISPSDYENLMFLENEILTLPAKEAPLNSSNTQTSEAGRPTNQENGESLTEAGNTSADLRG